MIDTYEKFRMLDENKKNDFYIEVNYDYDKDNQSNILKVTFPNGDICYLKRNLLNELLFALGNPEEQKKMIPQTLTRVKWYETVVSVKAKKDIQKGENITFPIKISLPTEKQEVIGEIKGVATKTKSGLIIPK